MATRFAFGVSEAARLCAQLLNASRGKIVVRCMIEVCRRRKEYAKRNYQQGIIRYEICGGERFHRATSVQMKSNAATMMTSAARADLGYVGDIPDTSPVDQSEIRRS